VAGPGQDRDEQYKFWTDYTRNRGCTDAQIWGAYRELEEAFAKRDFRLVDHFMGGDAPRLEDIVWFPTVARGAGGPPRQ